jgi:hypothetical protein
MTPAELTAHLDIAVYGTMRDRGVCDGIAWEVRDHPRTGKWRITIALPLAECPRQIADIFDAYDTEAGHALLGKLCADPDPAPVLAGVAGWRLTPQERR